MGDLNIKSREENIWWIFCSFKLKGKHFNISVVIVYAPSVQSTEEEIQRFQTTLRLNVGKCNSYGRSEYQKQGEKDMVELLVNLEQELVIKAEKNRYTSNDQVVTNTWFQEHARRVWIWRSPGGETKCQIDYIARSRNAVLQCKAKYNFWIILSFPNKSSLFSSWNSSL